MQFAGIYIEKLGTDDKQQNINVKADLRRSYDVMDKGISHSTDANICFLNSHDVFMTEPVIDLFQ